MTKALGKGLAIDVKQIFIHQNYAELNGVKWYYRDLKVASGYAAHLIIKKASINAIKIQKIKF